MRQKGSCFPNRRDLVTSEKAIEYYEGSGMERMAYTETKVESRRKGKQQTELSHQKKMWLKQWSKNT